jgi:ubiquinone/menaquinone biosynthesis C-methylase UbiE
LLPSLIHYEAKRRTVQRSEKLDQIQKKVKKMELGRIEKWFMNRPKHAKHVIARAEKLFGFVELKETRNFLEVGCGNGAVSKHFAKEYPLTVTGTDVDLEQIHLAKESIDDIPNVRFLKADATNLPFEDGGFDIVLSFQVMHHISNWLDALKEIRRVLRPKGYFIYADLLYPKLTAKMGKMFKHNYGITTLHDLTSFVQENDFSTIHSSLSKSLIFNHYEAVYRSNE